MASSQQVRRLASPGNGLADPQIVARCRASDIAAVIFYNPEAEQSYSLWCMQTGDAGLSMGIDLPLTEEALTRSRKLECQKDTFAFNDIDLSQESGQTIIQVRESWTVLPQAALRRFLVDRDEQSLIISPLPYR